MRGAHHAVGDQAAHEVAVFLLQRQVHLRRGAAELEQIARIHALTQMAADVADQGKRVAGAQRIGGSATFEIVDDPNAADRRRRQNGLAVGLVVERDVAADHREAELAAGFGHALDGAHDLAHDLRPLRVAEIEVVSHRKRACADRREVAPRFGHRLLAAFVRIGFDVARRDIAGHRQRALGAVEAHNRRVAAAVGQRVAHDVAVVLFPNPAFRSLVG